MSSNRTAKNWLEANREICMKQFLGEKPWLKHKVEQSAFNACAIDMNLKLYYYFNYEDENYTGEYPPLIEKMSIKKFLKEKK
jgi:hypothetical protein